MPTPSLAKLGRFLLSTLGCLIRFASLYNIFTAAAQCIVIAPVCGGRAVWVCYHDNSKLRASILTKLGF